MVKLSKDKIYMKVDVRFVFVIVWFLISCFVMTTSLFLASLSYLTVRGIYFVVYLNLKNNIL